MTPGLTGNTLFTPMLYPSSGNLFQGGNAGANPVETAAPLPSESVTLSSPATTTEPMAAGPVGLMTGSPAGPPNGSPGPPSAAYSNPHSSPYSNPYGGFSPTFWAPGSGNSLYDGAPFSPTAPLAELAPPFETPGAGGGGAIEAMFAAAIQHQQQQMIEMNLRMMEPTADQAAIASVQEIDSRPIGYVNGKNPSVRVVVLDGFQPRENGDLIHGEAVTEVLKRSGNLPDAEIQKIDDGARVTTNSVRLTLFPGMDDPSRRLDMAIELLTTEGLRRTSIVLESICNDPDSKVETINQSQSIDGCGTFDSLYRKSIDYTDNGPAVTQAGQYIFSALGLPPQTDRTNMREFIKRLSAKVDGVLHHSPAVLAERERHAAVSKRLSEQGVAYVIAAGNSREDMAMYEGLVPPDFEHNLLSNPYNVVVGAIDTKGTEARGDDTLASFSSRDPEVDFLAVGVDVPVSQNGGMKVDGTSFSSPHVAGKLSLLSKQHPGATATELQSLLRRQAGAAISGSSIPVIE